MPKSTRIKAAADLATREEFEALLNDIATDQLLREGLVTERDARIAEIQEEAGKEIGPIDDQIKTAVIRAEKFAAAHRAELFRGENKSAETALTFFGFRWSTPALATLNRKWNWEAVLKALKEQFPGKFILTEEKPDKSTMKAQLDAAQLARVGCRVTQSESFFVEPKRDEAPERRLVGEGKGVAA